MPILYVHIVHTYGHCDVQVDVIAASYSKLQAGIAEARNYIEARRAHEAFVDTLVSQSFLDLPHFSKLLMVLFALARRLCALLQVCTPCRWQTQATTPTRMLTSSDTRNNLSPDSRTRPMKLHAYAHALSFVTFTAGTGGTGRRCRRGSPRAGSR